MGEKLLLVRHGEGEHNLTGRLNGLSSQKRGEVIPLTHLGRRQMGLTSLRLEEATKVDVILSSPIARAVESAKIVARRFNRGVIIDSLLNERDFGVYDGKTINDILGPAMPGDTRSEQERLSEWVHRCIKMGDGMESSESLEQSMRMLFYFVRRSLLETTLGVSHSDTIRTAAAVAMGQSELSLSDKAIPYGSLTVISLPLHGNPELIAVGVMEIDPHLASYLRS